MENRFLSKLLAIRQAVQIGCSGAHLNAKGDWVPCSSVKQYMATVEPLSVKSRMSLDEMRERSSKRKRKGRKRRSGWEKLRERRLLGIGTTADGSLVSDNDSSISWNGKPGRTVTSTGGGLIPGIMNGNPNPPNMPGGLSVKSAQSDYSPRDNDTDVFIDIESARRRSRQLGCIGVSRRISKTGKTVWMPCTNMTDYNNLTGMTALGRLNQENRNKKIVRTVVSEELKKRRKSIVEEILGKSIGPKLSGSARTVTRTITERFDPNAWDGDMDGIVQEGTTFERPGLPKPNINKPSIPEFGKQEDITPESISAVKKWIDSGGNLEKLSSEPIEAFSIRKSTRGFASLSKPVKKESVEIEGLDNPEASPTNPFRNLGGKKMGEIIRGLVKPKNKNKKQRTTYLIGGTTGGGKSTVLDEHLVPNGMIPGRDEAAHVDPDFIKLGLPGYNDGAGAPIVHDESLRAAQHTMDDARKEGMDVVATGAGSTRQRAIIAQARKNGDKVVAHWVHVSQPEASRRIKQRELEQGRKIPDQTDHFARSIPQMVSSAVSKGEVDEFYIWDNEVEKGNPPRLIASFKGGKLEVHDKKKLDEFMNGNPLNPKPGTSELSTQAREALRESDKFMGFASRGANMLPVDDRKPSMSPRPDVASYEQDIEKIVSRSVPTSQQELEQIIADSPFTGGSPQRVQEILDYIKECNDGKELDWDEQKKLAEVLRKALQDSPALRKLLSETDIPPVLRTRYPEPRNQIKDFSTQISPWKTLGGSYDFKNGIVLTSPLVTSGQNTNYDGRYLSPEYLIRHELGHAIHAMLIRQNPGAAAALQKHLDDETKFLATVKTKLATLNSDMQNARALGMGKRITELEKQKKKVEKTITEWRHHQITKLHALEVSQYASAMLEEYIAEAIAYLTAPQHEFAIKAGPNKYPPVRSKLDHLAILADLLGKKRKELEDLVQLMS